MIYLYSWLGETDPHGDLLSHENVRIVGLAEAPFQLVELRRRKPGPVSLLFVRFPDVVAVGSAAGSGRSDGRGGGQSVASRGGQVETGAWQPKRPASAGRGAG